MALAEEPSAEALERKKTAAFFLGVGSVGFLFLGLVSLLLSPIYHRTFTGDELLVAGAVALATGFFLIVALVAVWYNKAWIGTWHD